MLFAQTQRLTQFEYWDHEPGWKYVIYFCACYPRCFLYA